MQLETRFRKQCIAASDSVGTEEITSDPSYGNTKALCVPDRIATSSLVEQPAPRPSGSSCIGREYPLTSDKNGWRVVVEYQGEEMPTPTDLLQGTLDLLILQTLALEPMHGWGVAQRIQQVSKDVLQVGQGSLYPALYRLEYKGWIKSDWGNSENNRRAKFYRLTAAGRKQLETELATWDRLSSAIALVLGRAG